MKSRAGTDFPKFVFASVSPSFPIICKSQQGRCLHRAGLNLLKISQCWHVHK